jgi:hypothetical protein
MRSRWGGFALQKGDESKIVRLKFQSMENMVAHFESTYPGWILIGVAIEQSDGTYDTYKRIDNAWVKV